MSSPNLRRAFAEHNYYHVYSRGVKRSDIFHDENDYYHFLNILERYLGGVPATDSSGVTYQSMADAVQLNAYCLMRNHFHLLLYQQTSNGIQRLMRRVLISYSMYYNKKYSSSGALFESRFQAVRINNDSYLQYITKYIHLNPIDWISYQYSSLRFYVTESSVNWVRPEPILGLFGSPQKYLDFLLEHTASIDTELFDGVA